jgi:hypothetical protein
LCGALAGTRFLFLDERDARTLTALRTTPLSMRQYLAYRVALPLLLGTASTLIGDPLTELTPLPMSTQLPIAIVAGVPHRSWQCACCRCAEQGCGVRCGESHERGEPSAGPRGSAPGSVRCRNFPKVLADARAVVGSGRRTLRCISRNRHSGSGLSLSLAVRLLIAGCFDEGELLGASGCFSSQMHHATEKATESPNPTTAGTTRRSQPTTAMSPNTEPSTTAL